MKKIVYFICSLFIFSCSNSLDVVPVSSLTVSSMWKSEEDVSGAMYGMYSQLRSVLNTNFIYWGDCRSGVIGDGLAPGANYQDMYNNTLDMQDDGTNWQSLYTTINDCNLILKYTPDLTFRNENDKNFILANAYFVRALCYFYAARVWGNVPILINGTVSDSQEDLYPSRSPLKDVLEQVKNDIEKSIGLFPNDNISSRKIASKAAANMLKTDFYLWIAKTQGGGTDALNEANSAITQVLTNSALKLSDNYENIFRNDDNEEIIFAINFEQNEATANFCSEYLIPAQYIVNLDLIGNPVQIGSHQQRCQLTKDFLLFLNENPNDTRTEVSFAIYYDTENNFEYRWINKYLGEWINNSRYFTSDIKLYRLAEAILFKAEIENALDNQIEALNRLNVIAKRAYGVDNYYSGTYDKKTLDELILNERLKELTVEGKSWFDLIRFGVVFDRVKTLAGRENEQNILFWPVNKASIDSNQNIKQTPGYD